MFLKVSLLPYCFYNIHLTIKHQFSYINLSVKEETYRKVVYHNFYYTLVARAVRMYPTHFKFSGCMTVELYGHYMSKGLCPQLVTKTQQTTCFGSGDCGSTFKECVAQGTSLVHV